MDRRSLGAGFHVAIACDLRIAGEGAQFGLPEVQINALPSWGGTYRLPRVVGIARGRVARHLEYLADDAQLASAEIDLKASPRA